MSKKVKFHQVLGLMRSGDAHINLYKKQVTENLETEEAGLLHAHDHDHDEKVNELFAEKENES